MQSWQAAVYAGIRERSAELLADLKAREAWLDLEYPADCVDGVPARFNGCLEALLGYSATVEEILALIAEDRLPRLYGLGLTSIRAAVDALAIWACRDIQ